MTTQDLSMPKVQDQPQTTTDEQKVDIQWNQLTVTLINQKQNANKVSQNDPLLNHSGEKFILNNLTGSARAGELTAIMGPSGAGKTTLVACLSKRFKRQTNQTFQGEILANNIPYTKYHEFGGFVMQDDLLMATLTVKETFLFVAQLRLQCDIAQRLSRVDQVIRDLKLRNCQNTYVGDALIKGISGGERKRTSIGIELISNPQVLILDEPTSGLDSFTAFICMNILKQIAKNQQRTIIFTIHQPSADIYNLFDKLIVLNHGQTVYQGQADQLIKYITRLGLDVDTFNNPIDVAMNNLTKFNKEEQIAALTYEKYQLYLQRDVEKTDVKSYGYNARKNETTFFYELKILMWRQFLNFSRNPNLLRSKIIGASNNFQQIKVFVSIFLSCLYWNIGKPEKSPPHAPEVINRGQLLPYLMNFTGGLFVCGTSAIFSALGPLLMIFPIERNIFLKEENSKMYRVSAYYISKVALEVPINVLIQICITLFLYWSYSLIWEFKNLSEFVLIAVLVSLCGNGIGIFTGCLFPDAKKSASLGPIVLLPLQLFGGQASNLANLPSFIKWVQYISPFKYFLEGFGRTQLDDVRFALPGDPDVDPSAFLGRVTGLWTCIYVLAGLAVGFHILGGIFLKLLVNKINV